MVEFLDLTESTDPVGEEQAEERSRFGLASEAFRPMLNCADDFK